jgi:hypothetical protein
LARVKGTAVRASLRYLQDRFGPTGTGAVLEKVPAEDREQVSSGLLDSVWYPMPLLLRLMRAASEAHGAAEPELARHMGRASAESGVRGVYKIFFKVGSPQFIISRASRVFGSYYDTGRIRVVESGPGRAVLDLDEFEGSPEFCLRILGWMEKTMEMAGARNLVPLHSRCRYRGDERCRFEGTWDA